MIEAPNLWELVLRRADETPTGVMAVAPDGRQLTFAEFRDRSERVAAALHRDHGIGPGSMVSWQLPTWLETIVVFGALRRLGAVQNPLLPIYRERELAFVVGQARPEVLIVPGTWAGFDHERLAGDVCRDVPTAVLVMEGELPQTSASDLPEAPDEDMCSAQAPTRYVYYTSGTTAVPKGARHGDRTLWAAAATLAGGLEVSPDDRCALVFPFAHIAGGVHVWMALATGARMLLDDQFTAQSTVPFLRDQRVTLAGSGTYFHQVYLDVQRGLPEGRRLFPEVRAFPGGGATKPPSLHGEVKAALGGAGVVSGYGLTEAPIVTMGHVDDDDVSLATTEGRPGPHAQIRITDREGRDRPVGEEGEIRVRAPQVMTGYLDPTHDADAFDADGWLRTGDLGHLDERGFLTVTGRLKDVIIRKGENISAKEVEDVLFEHPSVADVALVGLPDDDRGEMACAVVVPAGGTRPGLADLQAHLDGAGLTTRKWPERLELVTELPRNSSGKVLKDVLRDRLSETAQRPR